MTVTLDIFRTVAQAIHSFVVTTPCCHSVTLSRITGAEVILKFENLQFTGCFKNRGALVKPLSLTPEERRKGLVTMSAGNPCPGRSLPCSATWYSSGYCHASLYLQRQSGAYPRLWGRSNPPRNRSRRGKQVRTTSSPGKEASFLCIPMTTKRSSVGKAPLSLKCFLPIPTWRWS